MKDLKMFITDGEPEPKDKVVITEGMLSYHENKGHQRPPKKTFSILLRDENNRVCGCVIASILWNGMELETLWVDPAIERQGWGTKLLKAAELEGVKRGCAISYTNTFTWQAPQFYEKLGYSLYGKLEDFPEGNTLYYYCKKLS